MATLSDLTKKLNHPLEEVRPPARPPARTQDTEIWKLDQERDKSQRDGLEAVKARDKAPKNIATK